MRSYGGRVLCNQSTIPQDGGDVIHVLRTDPPSSVFSFSGRKSTPTGPIGRQFHGDTEARSVFLASGSYLVASRGITGQFN